MASSEAKEAKEAKAAWECPLCANPLESPTMLPCGRVFCQKHLHDYVNVETRQLKCPGCLQNHTLPKGGVSKLPQIDDFLNDMDVYTVNRDNLQEMGHRTGTQLEQLRESVKRDIRAINDEFDDVIHLVKKRRDDLLTPFKIELMKLNELEASIEDAIKEQTRANRHRKVSFEENIKLTQDNLLELSEQLKDWRRENPIIFTRESDAELDKLIANYGQTNWYSNYKLTTTLQGQESEDSFFYPRGLKLCPNTDNFYLTSDNAILEFDNKGTLRRKLETDFIPYDIAFDTKRRIIVTDCTRHKCHIYAQGLFLIKTFGSKGKKNGQFDGPGGVVCDRSDLIYIADTNNHRIQVFNLNGHFSHKFGMSELMQPEFLHLTHKDKLLVTDYCRSSGNVSIFTLSGQYEGSFGDGLLQWPKGICEDNKGFILVAEEKTKKIEVFTSELIHFTTLSKEDGVFDDMRGIAVSMSGSLYVTNWGSHEVQILY